MRSAVFNLIRCFLKLCIICSVLGQVWSEPRLTFCNTLERETDCNESEILRNVQITPISNEGNNISSNGIIEVNFTMPSLNCCYNIQLLVNKSVTKDACENYTFPVVDGYDKELLHTQKKICFEDETNSSISSCQKSISRKIDHVFTGCYALKYWSYTKRIVKDSKYIMSNYNQTEIWKPICTCHYRIYRNYSENSASDEYVEVDFTTRIPADVRIWKVSVDISAKKVRNFTSQSKNTSIFLMDMDNPSSFANYCMIKSHNNGSDSRTVECTFGRYAPQYTDYTIKLEFVDNRCRENALWKPKGCKWAIYNCSITIMPKENKGSVVKNVIGSNSLVFCVSILLFIVGVLMFMYRFRSRHNNITQYESTNTNEAKRTTNNDTNIDEINNLHIVPKNDDKSNGIILLYARSSPSFLVFMTCFGNILKRCCHCDVYDWYAANEWDNVAKLGPFDWVNELRKMGCRIVWVDTTFSRSLALSHSENHEETSLIYGDFRDSAFPVILDMAKRSIKDPAWQYQNHFIVRFDALLVHDSAEDPFADISPHVRYVMPRHFDQLCFDLSKQGSMVGNSTSKDIGATSEVQKELQRLMNTLQNF